MNETAENQEPEISLTRQSAWLLFAKIVGFGLSFLLPLLTVRYLAQDKVGVYRQSFQVIMDAISILPLGFSMSAFYFLNRQPEKRSAAIFNILLFNFCTGGLAFLTLFFFPQILGNIFPKDAAEMTHLAPLIGAVVWLWIFSTFLEVVALAGRETKKATVFIIAAQLTKTVLMAGAVVVFSTVEAFVWAAIFQGFLQTCVLIVYLKSRFPRFWTQFDASFFREQMVYALPFGLAGLLYTLQSSIHNYFVGYRFGAESFAIYSYGCFELPLIAMLYESISAVMIPRMSGLQAEGKKREMLTTSIGAMKKLALVYFPLFCFLMIVAEEFITTLFTKNYLGSVPIFRTNLILLPFYCLMLDPIGRAFPEVGSFVLKVRAVLFVALLAALYFGIQHFDLRGMIAIVVAVVLIERAVSLTKILKILEVRSADVYLLKSVGKTALAASVAGFGLLVFHTLAKSFLLEICINFSRNVLTAIHLEKAAAFFGGNLTATHFEKAADFFGGSLFLGICFAVLAAIYLFFANSLGALEGDDKEKLAGVFRKFARKRSANSGGKTVLPAAPQI